jgi:NADPH:quinone reductase-like Zn-dependent oxidoreductase
MPYLVRLVAGWPKPRNYVPGFDLAGHVETVGKKVTIFRPGDEVFAACGRACAEYACGPESNFALKPANLTFGKRRPCRHLLSPLSTVSGTRERCNPDRGC